VPEGQMRLSRVLCAFLICTTLLMACASPKTPGIHRRDRDSWPDTGTVRLADGLLPCAGATVLRRHR